MPAQIDNTSIYLHLSNFLLLLFFKSLIESLCQQARQGPKLIMGGTQRLEGTQHEPSESCEIKGRISHSDCWRMQTDRLCKLLRKCIWLCQLSPCLMCHRCQRGPGSRKETKFTDSLYSPGCVSPLDKGGIHNLTPFYSMQTLATLIADIFFSVWDSRCRYVHRATAPSTSPQVTWLPGRDFSDLAKRLKPTALGLFFIPESSWRVCECVAEGFW